MLEKILVRLHLSYFTIYGKVNYRLNFKSITFILYTHETKTTLHVCQVLEEEIGT